MFFECLSWKGSVYMYNIIINWDFNEDNIFGRLWKVVYKGKIVVLIGLGVMISIIKFLSII